ncbi:hypothetical protein [Psychroserpens sp. NJDZ02]|uniref:hypothetical protein n=1 Tax=Psychroserpens sp. NJDZ02 TaxID=2570561 RepID=UPI0010A896A7|nr:hypothetical protein [Psychroserpens sp. NJDZ02]QCE41636.1 hypothetical protein E9099_09475 [Psychroserpens sp. NJDZ02]
MRFKEMTETVLIKVLKQKKIKFNSFRVNPEQYLDEENEAIDEENEAIGDNLIEEVLHMLKDVDGEPSIPATEELFVEKESVVLEDDVEIEEVEKEETASAEEGEVFAEELDVQASSSHSTDTAGTYQKRMKSGFFGKRRR